MQTSTLSRRIDLDLKRLNAFIFGEVDTNPEVKSILDEVFNCTSLQTSSNSDEMFELVDKCHFAIYVFEGVLSKAERVLFGYLAGAKKSIVVYSKCSELDNDSKFIFSHSRIAKNVVDLSELRNECIKAFGYSHIEEYLERLRWG